MKRLTLLASLILAAISLFGQNYRPFHPSKLHFLIASPNNYSIRVDSVGSNGSDSLFFLNERAEPKVPNCTIGPEYGFDLGLEGYFGDHFVEQSNGRIVFVSRTGDSLFFETQYPINTSWNFKSGTNLTATITNKVSTMLFGVQDSIVTITVSDGNQFSLAKENGFYQGKNLGLYFGQANLGASMLARTPKRVLIKDFVDWQVGESFTYVYHDRGGFDIYDNYRVLGRYESPSGDSVVLYTELRNASFDLAASWNTNFMPMQPETLFYTSNNQALLKMATGEIDKDFDLLYLPTSWEFSGNRIKRNYLKFYGALSDLDSTGAYAGGLMTQDGCIAWPHHFSEDLGRVFWRQSVGSTTTTTLYADHELICYTKINESIPCPANALLTDIQSEIAAESKLWYGQNDAQIHWENIQPGNYNLRLMDIRGQVLKQEVLALGENGSQNIALPSTSGIYLLNLTNLKTQRSNSLKIAVTH